MFPIMGWPSIPWSLIAPYEEQAQRNHSQSLKRLAERGGLGICEAMAVMSGVEWEKRPIAKPTVEQWLDFIAVRKARAERRAAVAASMTYAQVKHMVGRFLAWRLPENFRPDAGISYVRPNYAPEVDATPSGTNLFDAIQAEVMVRNISRACRPPNPRAHSCRRLGDGMISDGATTR